MLSIDLSVNGSLRMLERALKSQVESISKLLMDGEGHTVTTKKAQASADVISLTKSPGLRIAKTTYPEQRLGFNQTFEHIRAELGALYERQNAPGWKATTTGADPAQRATGPANSQVVGNPLAPYNNRRKPQQRAAAPALKVAKTTYPDQCLDFNTTFRYIHAELRRYSKSV